MGVQMTWADHALDSVALDMTELPGSQNEKGNVAGYEIP